MQMEELCPVAEKLPATGIHNDKLGNIASKTVEACRNAGPLAC